MSRRGPKCCCADPNCPQCLMGTSGPNWDISWGTPTQNAWNVGECFGSTAGSYSYFNPTPDPAETGSCASADKDTLNLPDTDEPYARFTYDDPVCGSVERDHRFEGTLDVNVNGDGSITAQALLKNSVTIPGGGTNYQQWDWSVPWDAPEDCCNISISLAAADASYTDTYALFGSGTMADHAGYLLDGNLTLLSSCP